MGQNRNSLASEKRERVALACDDVMIDLPTAIALGTHGHKRAFQPLTFDPDLLRATVAVEINFDFAMSCPCLADKRKKEK